MNDDIDRLRLVRIESVGPITYRRLMARFETVAEAIAALPELAKAGGRRAAPKIPSPSSPAGWICPTRPRMRNCKS